jgi:hypothetical protein
MKKLLTPIILLFVLVSCEKRDYIEPIKDYTFSIDSVLTRDGLRSLPKDINGYYHLKITVNGTPQSHRITGRILVNNRQPNPSEKIDWESNMYWWLRRGDTLATVTKSYINYFTGQFTIVQLPPMVSRKDELVRTINLASYSGTNGEINTIISPIREMIGDTMVVQAKHTLSNKTLYTKIILE